MSWTSDSWTRPRNASMDKGLRHARPVIADQRGAGRVAGAARAAGAAEGAPPLTPTPPPPAAPARPAPARGDHGRSENLAQRGGGEKGQVASGAGDRRRRGASPFTPAEDQVLLAGKAAGQTYAQIAAVLQRFTRDQVANRGWHLLRKGSGVNRRSRAGQDSKPAPERAPPAGTRLCLGCRKPFWPDHRGNFVCTACKSNLAWRLGA